MTLLYKMPDTLRNALEETAETLQDKMDKMLPEEVIGRVGENRLARALRYSVLSSGKRIRPFLVIASSGLFGVCRESALQVAAATEFIHAYSLIHDDLPAMDDDDVRRGQPSLHKEFDEATAILAGDALLTMAFEVLAHHSTHSDSSVRAELVLSFAQACGVHGMVGGQMIDMLSEDRDFNIEQITRLQRMKTGALFAISCEAGAILGKASQSHRNALKGYAHNIGLVFQITDDLLDANIEANDSEDRQNKSEEKGTYVALMGKRKARQQAEILAKQAIDFLDHFDERSDLLKDLALFVLDRQR